MLFPEVCPLPEVPALSSAVPAFPALLPSDVLSPEDILLSVSFPFSPLSTAFNALTAS